MALSAPGKDKTPGKEPCLKEACEKTDSKIDIGGDKGKKPSPKKKIIKKAGTAAAVGVAGKKARSGLKDTFGKDED